MPKLSGTKKAGAPSDPPPSTEAASAPPASSISASIATSTLLWVVSELCGEGKLHVVRSSEAANAFDDGLIYGDSVDDLQNSEERPEGKPFKVTGDIKQGDKVWVVAAWDTGCCYAMKGVFAKEPTAAQRRWPADLRAMMGVGGTGLMDVFSYVVE